MAGLMTCTRPPGRFRRVLLLAIALGIGGAFSAHAKRPAALESFNHRVFEMNQVIVLRVLQPAMSAYRSHLPASVQRTIGAMYDNLLEPVSATAYALLGDLNGAARSTTRFAVNSTLGVLGAFDVAGRIGFAERRKEFSAAVCGAGLPLGGYVVLPVIGSTTVGIAFVGAALIVGSTYALSFVSTELALASVGVDVVAVAAALRNAVPTGTPAGLAYDAERRRFLDDLAAQCARSR